MFGDYSLAELGSILVMQGFSGLILFSVFLLMALGLAIIFGQMGVINMAHGEFMILGAYMTYLCSHLFEAYFPGLYSGYFFVAMAVAFIASGALGLLVEWLLIRHLYARPLDTLLATWGLSLIMQQAFRSIFGAREVGVDLPEWMMGSLQVTDTIEVQINGLFVMGLTLLITGIVANCVARTPGRSARFATRPLAGARYVVPSRSNFALIRSASDFLICALACDSVASAARNSLCRLARSLCACSRSARFPAPAAARAVNCSTRFFARSIRGVSEAFLFVALLS